MISLIGAFTFSNDAQPFVPADRLDEAEAVCHELLSRYPDQIDGTERLAEVYEARGEKKKAAQYYRKAAEFAQTSPGFDQELIDRYLSQSKHLESQE